MDNYKNSYLFLFNKLSDLSEEIVHIQQLVEELYLNENDNEILFPSKKAE